MSELNQIHEKVRLTALRFECAERTQDSGDQQYISVLNMYYFLMLQLHIDFRKVSKGAYILL